MRYTAAMVSAGGFGLSGSIRQICFSSATIVGNCKSTGPERRSRRCSTTETIRSRPFDSSLVHQFRISNPLSPHFLTRRSFVVFQEKCCSPVTVFPICASNTTLELDREKGLTTTMIMSMVTEERLGGGAGVLGSPGLDASSPDTASAKRCSPFEPEAVDKVHAASEHPGRPHTRREAVATILLVWCVPTLLTQIPGKLLAEVVKKENADKDQSIIGGLLSIFDPNETTKLGKKLPKAYLKSARDVVQTLRASFSEDAGNDAKFRRNADSAKGAIREYISNWRDAKLVGAEQSHQALERALRVLGEFYSKKGPTAILPEDVRVHVLEDLQKADDAL